MQKTRQPIDSMDGSTHDIPEVMVVEGGAAGTPAAGRWNPTKEQLTMLENLYRQGLRTPTAEQIQEITGRLLKYGHIEGKNVFYWFQNHKARQRQKEKQDHLSLFRYYNHHHHHHLRLPPPSFHLPPPPNVVYEPCYIQVPNNLGFYVPQPVSPTAAVSTIKPRSPPPIKPRSRTDVAGGFMFMHTPKTAVTVAGEKHMNYRSEEESVITGKNKSEAQETLELFPMHPTGILQEPVDSAGKGSCHASRACTSSLSGGTVAVL